MRILLNGSLSLLDDRPLPSVAVVDHQRGHRPPNLVGHDLPLDIGALESRMRTGDQRRKPLGRAQCARRRRVQRPRARITTPSPAQIEPERPGRDGEVDASASPAPNPTTEPHSATPTLTPTCRLVEATAEAAPARSVGMPLTAALVIGAFTIENPMPKTAKIDQQLPHRRWSRSAG